MNKAYRVYPCLPNRIPEVWSTLWAFVLCVAISATLNAQVYEGRVLNADKEPLQGAAVYWAGTQTGVLTDTIGRFQLQASTSDASRIVAKYVGHTSDTLSAQPLRFLEFTLIDTLRTQTLLINARKAGITLSDQSLIKTEQITQIELTKSACCDLAGCFETQATVQPQVTNVITNARELRMLGLSGVYNQVLFNGIPMMQGLSYTYGISTLPGSLVQNIYVAKGANSVVQGFESISGQINVETLDPAKADKIFLNLYMNRFQERHLNFHTALRFRKWAALTAFHMVQPASVIDRDGDRFMDLPQLKRYRVSQDWQYGSQKEWGWNARIGVAWLQEERTGGQVDFKPGLNPAGTGPYGQHVRYQQPEFTAQTGYRINDFHAFRWISMAYTQNQNSLLGTVRYRANQHHAYANLQHEFSYNQHELKTGISYRYFELEEHIDFYDTVLNRTYDGRYLRLEHIPGVFAENTLELIPDKLTWMQGVRLDYHNTFGYYFTPRSLLKFMPRQGTVFRINTGTGWRTANVFTENIQLLTGSRNLIFQETLNPEKAFNTGINYTQKINAKSEAFNAYFTVDYYYTRFQNQIFPDYDRSPLMAILQNFTGVARSHVFQAEVGGTLLSRIELKVGYVWLDVYRRFGETKFVLPFNPKHRYMAAFSYKPLHEKYHLDVNMHYTGRQRLPDTRSNPEPYRRPDFSESFVVFNAQFTYSPGRLEVYVGCENIFDFRQLRPINAWQEPLGPYFDTSMVWGPTRGREVYAGIRWRIKYPNT
jgi:outer membrane receptor for ferrienterochelin and colicins